MSKRPTIAQLQRELAITNDALEAALSASPITDNNFFPGGLSGSYTDRNQWDRKKLFAEGLRAWRVNPVARRIVNLARAFIIGNGLTISLKPQPRNIVQKAVDKITGRQPDQATLDFLTKWWNDPLNDFPRNIRRWKDEETRTGNLFFLFTVAESGMTYVRAVPCEQIEDIKTSETDIEQETEYMKDAAGEESWKAFDPEADQTEFMVHFATNAPVGTPWGESDFNTLLVWIGRFSTWLEDRVRLNHFRSAFMYVIFGDYASEDERQKRENYVNSHPPKPGSVLVANRNNGEAWGILAAQLDAFDSSVDGKAIKTNIATGIGYPMHWLAEPEDTNRTTAEAAGTPTFRSLQEQQTDFMNILLKLARTALIIRRRSGDRSINTEAPIQIEAPDITERDNATLALALARAYPALSDMYDRKLINETELTGIAYRMMAEPFDGTASKGLRKNINKPSTASTAEPDQTDPTDPPQEEPK